MTLILDVENARFQHALRLWRTFKPALFRGHPPPRGGADAENTDTDRAQEHHDAAYDLLAWVRGLPRQEEKAAWERGWNRAMHRANRRIAELEAVISSQQTSQNLPAPSPEWHAARQDPRYALVRREILALDTVTGEMALPYPLQELLALRLISALRTAELPQEAPTDPGAA